MPNLFRCSILALGLATTGFVEFADPAAASAQPGRTFTPPPSPPPPPPRPTPPPPAPPRIEPPRQAPTPTPPPTAPRPSPPPRFESPRPAPLPPGHPQSDMSRALREHYHNMQLMESERMRRMTQPSSPQNNANPPAGRNVPAAPKPKAVNPNVAPGGRPGAGAGRDLVLPRNNREVILDVPGGARGIRIELR